MNKVILMGRLARDPDLRYSTSGQSVCRYTLAVNRSYKREGDPDADFINIVSDETLVLDIIGFFLSDYISGFIFDVFHDAIQMRDLVFVVSKAE